MNKILLDDIIRIAATLTFHLCLGFIHLYIRVHSICFNESSDMNRSQPYRMRICAMKASRFVSHIHAKESCNQLKCMHIENCIAGV